MPSSRSPSPTSGATSATALRSSGRWRFRSSSSSCSGSSSRAAATNLTLGYVDQDGTPAATQLYDTFTKVPGVKMVVTDATDATNQMKTGKVDGVVLVPAGYQAGLTAAAAGVPPAMVDGVTDPSSPQLSALGLSGRRGRSRHRQPRRASAIGRPRRRDRPDREPQRDQLLRAEHARAVDHAGRDLRRHPARRRPREADPQAPGRDPAPALAARWVERPDAGPDRPDPGGDHRGGRRRCSSASK